MHFIDEVKQNYIKQHSRFGVRCGETPEICMISAWDKVGATVLTAKLHEGENFSQSSWRTGNEIFNYSGVQRLHKRVPHSPHCMISRYLQYTFTPDCSRNSVIAIACKSIFENFQTKVFRLADSIPSLTSEGNEKGSLSMNLLPNISLNAKVVVSLMITETNSPVRTYVFTL